MKQLCHFEFLESLPQPKGDWSADIEIGCIGQTIERNRETIELCLEVERDLPPPTEFIGVQRMAV